MDGTLALLGETLAGALVLVGTVGAVVALSGVGLLAAIRRIRGPRASRRVPETLFVGRWGRVGPELYRVGATVRRLPADPAPVAFAKQVLAEVLPGPAATHLARAFAEARLEPLPPDGFVLSKSEVEAWLDAHVAWATRSSSRPG